MGPRINWFITFPGMEVMLDRPIVPWILLPTPFEVRVICFPSVLRHVSQFPWLFKNQSGLSVMPASSWVNPLGPMGLWMSSLHKYSLTWPFLTKCKSGLLQTFHLVSLSFNLLFCSDFFATLPITMKWIEVSYLWWVQPVVTQNMNLILIKFKMSLDSHHL